MSENSHGTSRGRRWVLRPLAEIRADRARHRPGLRPCHTAQPGPHAPICVPQGELTITTDMEDLSTALFYDTVPDTWVARAYPSMMGLAAWYADLLLRIRVRTVRGAPAPRARRNRAPRPRWPGLGQGRAGRA